jgi:hypothetical protein
MILKLFTNTRHFESPTVMDSTKLVGTKILKFFVCIANCLHHNAVIFFLLKKSLVASVTLLLGSDVNGMWVPFMAPQILGKLIRSWKWFIIFYKRSPDGLLLYLLNNLFLSHRVSHTMSTYFLMVDAPTLNQSALCVALVPWSNL